MNNSVEEMNPAEAPNSTHGMVLTPLAAAAALDSHAFAGINASDAIPAAWEDRARKAWEYYTEEPLVKNAVNSWRTFAVGDEIKIKSDDDTVTEEAVELRPYVGSSFEGSDIFSAFTNHTGHGGLDRHPAVTVTTTAIPHVMIARVIRG